VIYHVDAPLKDWHPIAALQNRNLKGGHAMPVKYKPAPCSQKELRDIFDYCKETGRLLWKPRPRVFAGQPAGCANANGYVRIRLNQSNYWAHRLVWYWHSGNWPKEEIDHINGRRDDNRIENLRTASRPENRQNTISKKQRKGGLAGASFCSYTNRWRATIAKNGKKVSLGRFDTAEEAHEAYLKAKAELHTFQPAPRAA
jgi:hypothetical protein